MCLAQALLSPLPRGVTLTYGDRVPLMKIRKKRDFEGLDLHPSELLLRPTGEGNHGNQEPLCSANAPSSPWIHRRRTVCSPFSCCPALPHLPDHASVRPSWLSPANLHLYDPLIPGEGDRGRMVGCGIFSAKTTQGQLITYYSWTNDLLAVFSFGDGS